MLKRHSYVIFFLLLFAATSLAQSQVDYFQQLYNHRFKAYMSAVRAYNKAVKKRRPQNELKRLERAVNKLKRECGKAKARLDTAKTNQRKTLRDKGSGGSKEPNIQAQQLIMDLENKLRNLQEQFRVEGILKGGRLGKNWQELKSSCPMRKQGLPNRVYHTTFR